MSVRVLVADDQAMVRTGFHLILDAEPDIDVVGEAADGRQAVDLARELRPDVTLMDIRMPLVDGIEATRLLAGPGVPRPLRVVVVTTFDLDENVYAALRAGACGFILKDAGPRLLVEAVHSAVRGEALVSPTITTRLLQHFLTGTTAAAGPAGPIEPTSVELLTDREVQVLRAVGRGGTNTEIANELGVSISTVKSHLAAVQRKLQVRNRTEIAVWAWANRVVT